MSRAAEITNLRRSIRSNKGKQKNRLAKVAKLLREAEGFAQEIKASQIAIRRLGGKVKS